MRFAFLFVRFVLVVKNCNGGRKSSGGEELVECDEGFVLLWCAHNRTARFWSLSRIWKIMSSVCC